MLFKRVISICALIPCVVSALFYLSLIQFSVFLFILCLICSWEWGNLMRFSVSMRWIWMSGIVILLLNIMMIMITQKYSYLNYGIGFFFICVVIMLWWLVIFLLVLFYPDSTIFWSKFKILRFCFGVVVIIPFFFGSLTLYQLHYNNFFKDDWLLYILELIWINDSGAYVIGKMIGKYKLLKNVSPQKTWEGCIGGISLSIITAWFFSKNIAITVGSFYLIFFLFVGTIIFAVIGDLTESMFKREAGVKDASSLIPGHGGLLDRIDSLIFSIPFFTFFILLFVQLNNIEI